MLFVVQTFLNSEKSLFWKSCSSFLKGLNFVFESCYIFLCFLSGNKVAAVISFGAMVLRF